jgi:hypothetical protein
MGLPLSRDRRKEDHKLRSPYEVHVAAVLCMLIEQGHINAFESREKARRK